MRTPLRATDNSTREKLLLSAKKLFARKGLSGTSIRDIANEAKINSSMISYYFDSKEGLYRECLRMIGETRLQFVQQILQPPKTKDEFRVRSQLFIENIFTLFIEDRDTGLILIREYDRVNSPAEKVFKETFLKAFEQLIDFFKSAQKNKLIEKSRDPFIVAGLFFGALSSRMRLDHINSRTFQRSIKDPEERKKVLNHLVDIFCQ